MKILHYTIGFAPVRTGGLVSYATDLMLEEINQGQEVYALYPALQTFFAKSPIIKLGKEIKGIKTYELYNSLPLALFGGIYEPDDFKTPCDIKIFSQFLKELKPDVIHLHSLMGLHKEFFEAAKSLNIRLIFTTHDYYGLAPIPSFYYNGKSFDEDNNNLAWNIMSHDALPTNKLRIFQSKWYIIIRDILKKMNKNPKHISQTPIKDIRETKNYATLKQYYLDIFALIDCFHFNSQLAKNIFESNVKSIKESAVISITTSQIKAREVAKNTRKKMHLAFIGPDEVYKGYFDFLDYISTINTENYTVYTYGHYPNDKAPSFVKQMGRFKQEDLLSVYENIDILVVPSQWKETFGLVVLEALSYGVTVYVSENVGAKDLVSEEYIFKSLKELESKLLDVDSHAYTIKDLNQHTKELLELYKGDFR
ncbi:glycosyltransferase [Streptococcus sp. zg-JUN1979]|uniref:glycosyltransferase n=1 Tax=Streptococcus sp. zg-JUN1979 TaxID=3391450 RepID=UPI0039A6C264